MKGAILALLACSVPASADAPAAWPHYEAMLWQDPTPAGLRGLAALGITATRVLHPLAADGRTAAAMRRAAGVRWYDENLATDFYAAYHRWRPDRPITWAFDQVRARHAADPADAAVFERDPSLSDPAWTARIRARLLAVVRDQAPDRPFFYSLGDETGIADLAAAWDFDRSPASLAAMRVWLHGRYADLAALNRAWGTRFADWKTVVPATTDQALRDDAAVPSWMAFKQWMDVAFATSVRAGTDAVHAADPGALAGIEGAQVPGWGGYDYTRLAPAVDVMEIYDDLAIDVARSLHPGLVVLTTSAAAGPADLHAIWHAFLQGSAGTILWDDGHAIVAPDGAPGPRASSLAPLLQELESPVGDRFLAARPAPAQVGIVYSQASFRLDWLLARRAEATPWTARDAAAETIDGPWRAAARRADAAFAGLGVPVRWLNAETVGDLTGLRVLVLPHCIALSDTTLAAIRRFAQAGGMVLADIAPGAWDDDGHHRPMPPPLPMRLTDFLPDAVAAALDAAEVARPLSVLRADGQPASGVDIRLFRSGPTLLAGIQRTTTSPDHLRLTLHIASPMRVERLDADAPPVRTQAVTLDLDPVRPALLALSP